MSLIAETIGAIFLVGLVVAGIMYLSKTVTFKDLGDNGKDK